MTTYESLLTYPATRPTDKRLASLESTCQELRKYHIKANPSKRNIIQKLLFKYESLLDRIQNKLEGA